MQLTTPFKRHVIVTSKIETKISLSVMSPQKTSYRHKSGEMFYIPRFFIVKNYSLKWRKNALRLTEKFLSR